MTEAWAEGWKERLQGRLADLGCETVTDFLGMFPVESYIDVAKRLGSDVAAVQLVWGQFDEAKAAGRVREAALDHLVRSLAEAMKRKGWGVGIHWDRIRARGFSTWSAAIKGHFPGEYDDQVEAVLAALKTSPPPEGWRPQGNCDPYLIAALETGWPQPGAGQDQEPSL